MCITPEFDPPRHQLSSLFVSLFVPTDREQMRALILRYGWNSTCHQLVNRGFQYWFNADQSAGAAYVEYAGIRIVGGSPVCAKMDLPEIVRDFESTPLEQSLRVCYFASEARLEACIHGKAGYSTILLGGQPVWSPKDLASTINEKSSLRMQVHRARNKGIVAEEWSPSLASSNPGLQRVLEEWLATRGLPSLHFLVEPETLSDLLDRRIFVALRKQEVVGFLVASPIPERNGWLVEQFVRGRAAPNGTIELLLDLAARTLARENAEYITLGLSPLSAFAGAQLGGVSPLIRFLLYWARAHGNRFYNFAGLEAFKSKFEPTEWEPIYAISNEPRFSLRTLYAIACAFTCGRPLATVLAGIGRAVRMELRWLSNPFSFGSKTTRQ